MQREQKGQARLAKLRAKAGYNMGGAAPSDTVPALLTPANLLSIRVLLLRLVKQI